MRDSTVARVLHRNAAEGWGRLELVEQLGNVGSEVERAIRAHEAGRTDRFESALERALELFDLTACDPRWRGHRCQEILRAREQFCRLSSSTPTCRPTRPAGSGGTSSDSRGPPGRFIIVDRPGTTRSNASPDGARVYACRRSVQSPVPPAGAYPKCPSLTAQRGHRVALPHPTLTGRRRPRFYRPAPLRRCDPGRGRVLPPPPAACHRPRPGSVGPGRVWTGRSEGIAHRRGRAPRGAVDAPRRLGDRGDRHLCQCLGPGPAPERCAPLPAAPARGGCLEPGRLPAGHRGGDGPPGRGARPRDGALPRGDPRPAVRTARGPGPGMGLPHGNDADPGGRRSADRVAGAAGHGPGSRQRGWSCCWRPTSSAGGTRRRRPSGGTGREPPTRSIRDSGRPSSSWPCSCWR